MLLLSESGNENFSERGGGFGEMEASLKIPRSRTLLSRERPFFACLMRKKCFRHSETSLDKEAKCIHKQDGSVALNRPSYCVLHVSMQQLIKSDA